MRIRNREYREIVRRNILPDPLNWRVHPEFQRDALRESLAEVGFVGALLVRPAKGRRGKFYCVDGHERLEHFEKTDKVPCIVLDVDEAEARKVLATYDAITNLADIDPEALRKLTADIEFDGETLRELVADVLAEFPSDDADEAESEPTDETEELDAESYQIMLTCNDEAHQAKLLERFQSEGIECRALIA